MIVMKMNRNYKHLVYLLCVKLLHEVSVFDVSILVQRKSIHESIELIVLEMEVEPTLDGRSELLLTYHVQTQLVYAPD